MRQTEYLLKGLYLGLVFFAALQQAEASPAGSWDSLARVNLSTLAGFVLAVVLAAVTKLREGYRGKGRLLVFVLFLLLESPTLVYAGSRGGTVVGIFQVRQAGLEDLLLPVLGGGA